FKTDIECHNIVALSRDAITGILAGCLAGFMLLATWSCRASRRLAFRPDRAHPGPVGSLTYGEAWRLAAEFSVVVLGMLLFSERTWKHHCVTLLLPFTVLAYCLSAFWPRNRTWLIGTLATVFLLIASTSTGLFGDHDRFGKVMQAYGAYVWANLIML